MARSAAGAAGGGAAARRVRTAARPANCGDARPAWARARRLLRRLRRRGDEGDCEKPGEASPVVGSPPSLPRRVARLCGETAPWTNKARCGRRARVAKAVAQAAMQPGATQCAIVAGRAAVDADALILALAELPESDTAAVADDELARGVAARAAGAPLS